MDSAASVAPTISPLPSEGDVLGDRFVIERVLGQGGMCMVYAARHAHLGGLVAIKVLRPDVVAEALSPNEMVERFLREGRAACQIKSEHVVRTFDVGTLLTGDPFLVMEYLDGRDLEGLLRDHGPLPVEAAVDYILQAGEAIAEAHSLGIIHRDLKPANLFLTVRPDGAPFIKVLDFGISKIVRTRSSGFHPSLTGSATVMGSPHYMSPEQLRATRDVDVRTDIWSLGAVLQELLSGKPPFSGNTMPEVCANILRDPPEPLATLRPEVPPTLVALILRCLEKEPAARFSSMAELASALAHFATPAGQASAQRIIGITRSAPPPALHSMGGDHPTPPEGTVPWGETDRTFRPPKPPRARRRLTLALFATVMLVTGGIATAAFVRPDVAARFDAMWSARRHTTPASVQPATISPPPGATLTQGDLPGPTAAASPAPVVIQPPSGPVAAAPPPPPEPPAPPPAAANPPPAAAPEKAPAVAVKPPPAPAPIARPAPRPAARPPRRVASAPNAGSGEVNPPPQMPIQITPSAPSIASPPPSPAPTRSGDELFEDRK